MTQLASWLRRSTLNAQHEQAIAKAVREAKADAPPHPNTHVPGDARALRGIPVVGVHGGIGGAIQGSRPDNVG